MRLYMPNHTVSEEKILEAFNEAWDNSKIQNPKI